MREDLGGRKRPTIARRPAYTHRYACHRPPWPSRGRRRLGLPCCLSSGRRRHRRRRRALRRLVCRRTPELTCNRNRRQRRLALRRLPSRPQGQALQCPVRRGLGGVPSGRADGVRTRGPHPVSVGVAPGGGAEGRPRRARGHRPVPPSEWPIAGAALGGRARRHPRHGGARPRARSPRCRCSHGQGQRRSRRRAGTRGHPGGHRRFALDLGEAPGCWPVPSRVAPAVQKAGPT